MKRMAMLVAVLAAAGAMAQEIGTEIQPVTPTTSGPQTGNRAFDPNAGPATRGNKKVQAPVIEDAVSGASAGRGMFGVRINLQGATLTTPPAAVGNPYAMVPSMGFSYFLDNELTLLFDIGGGFGMTVSDMTWNLGLLVGIDYHFRKISDSIRPLINIQVGVATPANTTVTSDMAALIPRIGVAGQFGGGAEYFFNPHFSVSGKVLVAFGYGLEMAANVGHLSINTTPAVSAAWYF